VASLINNLKSLKESGIRKLVNTRLKEFESYKWKNNSEWFSELCFCLLTANSKASTALNIQKELGPQGFCNACSEDVKTCIISNKHRFHNNKTNFIIRAREHLNIKDKITSFNSSFNAREWLVKNIKGFGYKEASHFLRNVGYTNLAILDRHILRLLHEHNYIKEVPKSLSKKNYYEIEKVLQFIGEKVGMNQSELDLYLWYSKTGKVLK
jgi:N-glycosylase/DNA lyase